MNRVQAKAKLAEINRSTATKHPKVLISELCGIVQFLLGELERIETPKMTVLTNLPPNPYDLDQTRRNPGPRPWKSPPPFSPDTQPPMRKVIPTESKRPIVDEPFTETGPPLDSPLEPEANKEE